MAASLALSHPCRRSSASPEDSQRAVGWKLWSLPQMPRRSVMRGLVTNHDPAPAATTLCAGLRPVVGAELRRGVLAWPDDRDHRPGRHENTLSGSGRWPAPRLLPHDGHRRPRTAEPRYCSGPRKTCGPWNHPAQGDPPGQRLTRPGSSGCEYGLQRRERERANEADRPGRARRLGVLSFPPRTLATALLAGLLLAHGYSTSATSARSSPNDSPPGTSCLPWPGPCPY